MSGNKPKKSPKKAAKKGRQSLKKSAPYPKPGAVGGKLIREVIGLLRQHQIQVPVTSHILIGVSGGADSMALAHLIVHYGRRVADRSKITLLHVNHGWRGKESDADAKFVERAAKDWGVSFEVFRLKASDANDGPAAAGESWEDVARIARKNFFMRQAKEKGAVVLTAHHADDLAETVLWRLMTGSHETHGGGIAVKHGVELRPLLRIRKRMLKDYLKEEGQSWREDVTNFEGRFLRARVRAELMPAVERIFPRAVERLVALGLEAQLRAGVEHSEKRSDEPQALESLLAAAGLRIRRSHWELLDRVSKRAPLEGEVHLPGGWRLKHQPAKRRWILEKPRG